MPLVLVRLVKGQPLAALVCMGNIASVVDTHSMLRMLHFQMYQLHTSQATVHRFPGRLFRSAASMLPHALPGVFVCIVVCCAHILTSLLFAQDV